MAEKECHPETELELESFMFKALESDQFLLFF